MRTLLSGILALAASFLALAQTDATNSLPKVETQPPADWLDRLRDEGTNRSQIVSTFQYLTDVIGGRLTASPSCRRANDWTRDTLASWGLTNAHLEPWGPFGRGWSVKRFSAQVILPQCIPLVAWPKAWSYGVDWPFVGDVVLLDARNEAELEKYRGQLKGAIVLISQPRDVPISFDPVATRLNETNLLRMANAGPRSRAMRPGSPTSRGPRTNTPPARPPRPESSDPTPASSTNAPSPSTSTPLPSATNPPPPSATPPQSSTTNAPAPSTPTIQPSATNSPSLSPTPPQPSTTNAPPPSTPVPQPPATNSPSPSAVTAQLSATNAPPPSTPPPSRRPPRRTNRSLDAYERLRFAVQEGAAATISVSMSGSGGALSVGSALVVAPPSQGTNKVDDLPDSPWDPNAPASPPQIVLAAEQYNRLVHMIQAGERLKIALDVQTEFTGSDLMCYNTVADLPGTDLAKEIVMLGAHIDSIAGGTGATDNAVGVAVCMEAIRLIKAAKLQPRRTLRIGIWTGEEQGLNGSRAYVEAHFGYTTNAPSTNTAASARSEGSFFGFGRDFLRENRRLVKHKEYDRLSAYYNLDNGAGRIRGIYLQGNEPLRQIFRPWLDSLRDLGAETISASDTGGTDHLSFDRISLPGFQFIQDPVEYWRSYHTTIDVRERAPVDDIQQAAIVMAAFVYRTAMLDERLPRKPFDPSPRRF
jgi:hypothetical protein